MFTIQVPTVMRRVAEPMSWAVAITSLFTSAAKIASKPAPSASRAIAWMSFARQPTPGMVATATRSAIAWLLPADRHAGELLEDLDDADDVFLVEAGGAGRLVKLLGHVGQEQRHAELLGEGRLQLLVLERDVEGATR